MFRNSFGGAARPRMAARHITASSGVMTFFVTLVLLAAIGVGALMIVAGASGRARASNCIGIGQALERAAAIGARFEPLVGEQSRRAITIYDLVPPQVRSGAELAALVHLADGGGLIAVGGNGLYCGSAAFEPSAWPRAVSAIMGEPA